MSERSESNRGPECSDDVKGQSLAWTAYILLCRNGKFYVGSTGDMDRRLKEHFSGNGGGHYTKCNPPVRLAYTEEFPSRDRAERRERQLKGWTHAKKQALTAPWNRWYHCMASAYGSWLYGDPRGFRTRHHREHVEGDYRNPPPEGEHAEKLRLARESMRYPPVVLSRSDRIVVCRAMADKLVEYDVELVELSVGGQHAHILCRFPASLSGRAMPRNLLADGRCPIPRHLLGRAKRAASVALLRLGRKARGRPLWSKRTKIKPIRSRGHQIAVVRYIRDHAREGAAVWSQLDR